MNAEVNDADLIGQKILDTEMVELTSDEVQALVQAYRRVVKDRDEWQRKHDEVFASREALRQAVEDAANRTIP